MTTVKNDIETYLTEIAADVAADMVLFYFKAMTENMPVKTGTSRYSVSIKGRDDSWRPVPSNYTSAQRYSKSEVEALLRKFKKVLVETNMSHVSDLNIKDNKTGKVHVVAYSQLVHRYFK